MTIIGLISWRWVWPMFIIKSNTTVNTHYTLTVNTHVTQWTLLSISWSIVDIIDRVLPARYKPLLNIEEVIIWVLIHVLSLNERVQQTNTSRFAEVILVWIEWFYFFFSFYYFLFLRYVGGVLTRVRTLWSISTSLVG